MVEQSDYGDPSGLFVAVSKAAGHGLDVGVSDDRLVLQHGCYILNRWGFGPFFDYPLFIHGPYSTALADAYFSGYDSGLGTDVPDEAVSRLSEVFSHGMAYGEAYVTLMLIIEMNPGEPNDVVIRQAQMIKPRLSPEIWMAAGELFQHEHVG